MKIAKHLSDTSKMFFVERMHCITRPRRCTDGYTVQVSGCAMGFGNVGGSVTCKRRPGFNMKDTLIERWRNGLRNIADLESFSGVEVSLCTRNARRRRLWQILGSPTIYSFLKGNTFEWKNIECEKAYYKALSSRKRFRQRFRELYADKNFRVDVGDAISACLDALAETGVDDDTGELSAIWVQSIQIENPDEDLTSDTSSLARKTLALTPTLALSPTMALPKLPPNSPKNGS
jgi:hypothetical protein